MKHVLTTDSLQDQVVDCCVIIRWRADHPDRELPDLPRPHAERLLEDLVAALRPHLRQIEILEQPRPGQVGQRIRLWDSAQERVLAARPPHSTTWFQAVARALSRQLTRPPEGE